MDAHDQPMHGAVDDQILHPPRHGRELDDKLSAVWSTFQATLSELDLASRAMRDHGTPPGYHLLESLGNCHRQFLRLRNEVVRHASALGDESPTREGIESLRQLSEWIDRVGVQEASTEPSIKQSGEVVDPLEAPAIETPVPAPEAINDPGIDVGLSVDSMKTDQESPIVPQAIIDPRTAGLRDAALLWLARARRLDVKSGPDLPELVGFHYKAGRIRTDLENGLDPESSDEAMAILAGTHPIARLLTVVEGQEALNDSDWAAYHSSLTEAFGRDLAGAAFRGRLFLRPE